MLQDRVSNILHIVEQDRGQIADFFNNVDVKFTPEEEQQLKSQLQIAQTRLEKISEMLNDDRRVLDVADNYNQRYNGR